MPDVTKEQVVDFLSKMSVMDLATLTKELGTSGASRRLPSRLRLRPLRAAALRPPRPSRPSSPSR
jgi:hypothetical protein